MSEALHPMVAGASPLHQSVTEAVSRCIDPKSSRALTSPRGVAKLGWAMGMCNAQCKWTMHTHIAIYIYIYIHGFIRT